jgi:hypothetical protein
MANGAPDGKRMYSSKRALEATHGTAHNFVKL